MWYNTQKEIGQGDAMAVLKCKMCGGDIELSADKTIGVCDSCGSTTTFPKVDDEQRANMFNRGNHFRRSGEFDKALAVYERIVQENEDDAEAHWCCALCRFGIEYVEDPNTFEFIPTCHRASFDSFLEDVDYLAALEHSDGVTRRQYQKDAQKIAEVQRGILATSQNEEPFDVFICYKETEDDGRRTRDSLFAQDIYYQLTEQGRRVFFSRITLEDKAGTEYEPYIFAALNSAKVMIVVTTSAEHVNAVWVKNEWSRFLSLMRKDRSKLLLPCYRDMDPYDLPEALSVLQSYDMSKIGFIQDLTRGVNKVLNADRPKETVKETVVVQPQRNTNAAPLLERAFMFLEDGDWDSANEYCEKVLDIEPKNAEAYLGKLMADVKAKKREDLKDCAKPFDDRNNYRKAIRFGDEKLKAELTGDIAFIKDRNETARKEGIYQNAVNAMHEANDAPAYTEAAELFKTIPGYRDADALAEQCVESAKECDYTIAVNAMNKAVDERTFKKASELFKTVPRYRDADALAEQCLNQAEVCRKDEIYTEAKNRMQDDREESYKEAIFGFKIIPGWKDADELLAVCEQRIEEITRKRQEIERQHKAFVDDLNRRISDAEKEKQACQTELSNLKGLFNGRRRKELEEQIEAANQVQCYYRAQGLIKAGKYREAISPLIGAHRYREAGSYLKKCWDHVAVRNAIAAGYWHTVGLKSDGTVVAIGWNDDGRCNVSDWKDIVAIAAGYNHTVGLRADGTVVATGENDDGKCNVSGWTDIVAIAVGSWHTVGLRSDGTVVATGENDGGQCDVSGWKDIVAIAAGGWHTVGLRSDGTVVATSSNSDGQCDVSGWKDIKVPDAK